MKACRRLRFTARMWRISCASALSSPSMVGEQVVDLGPGGVGGELALERAAAARGPRGAHAARRGPRTGAGASAFATVERCVVVVFMTSIVGARRSIRPMLLIRSYPCASVMDMETEVLRWFAQVADGMTVTEVAEIDRVSQPGVSRALARLDREMGTPLLQRSGRLLRPTRAGSRVQTTCRRDAPLPRRRVRRHQRAGGPGDGHRDPDLPALARHLAGPRPDQPRSGRRTRACSSGSRSPRTPSAPHWSRRGRTDLEFTASRPTDPELHWQPLFSQPLVLAVPPRHALAGRRDEVSLSDAADIDFVMLRPPGRCAPSPTSCALPPGSTPSVAFEGDDLAVVRGFRGRRAGRGRRPGDRRRGGREPRARRAPRPPHRRRRPPRRGRGLVGEPPATPLGRALQGVRARRRPSLHVGDRHDGWRLGQLSRRRTARGCRRCSGGTAASGPRWSASGPW